MLQLHLKHFFRSQLVHLMPGLFVLCGFTLTASAQQASGPDAQLLEATRMGDVDAMQRALSSRANPNAVHPEGGTALMWAAYGGNLEAVRLLVKHKADCAKKDVIWLGEEAYYGNLLGVAAGEGYLDVLAFFIEECGIPVDDKEWNPNELAATGWAASQWAVNKGHAEIVRYLANKGADLTIVDENGWGLLLYAVTNGEYTLIKFLLDQGLDVNQGDKSGIVPLIFAVVDENHLLAEILYCEGADISKEWPGGGTIQEIVENKGDLVLTELFRRPPCDDEHVAFLVEVGRLKKKSEDLQNQGEFTEALNATAELIQLQRAKLGNRDIELAPSLVDYAGQFAGIGDFRSAIQILHEALEIQEAVFGPSDFEVGMTINHLGLYHAQIQEFEDATAHLDRALRIYQDSLGMNNYYVAATLTARAFLQTIIPDYNAAISNYEQLLKIHRELVGTNHPDYADILKSLAGIYEDLSEYETARDLKKQALEIYQGAGESDNEDLVWNLKNQAEILKDLGEYEQALPLYEQALSELEATYGPNHPNIAGGLSDLAGLYEAQEQFSTAIKLRQRSLDIAVSTYGENHIQVSNPSKELAMLYLEVGNYRSAISLLTRSLEIIESSDQTVASLGKAAILKVLGRAYHNNGDFSSAHRYYQEALRSKSQIYGDRHPETGEVLYQLALLNSDEGNYKVAEDLYRKVLEIFRGAFGQENALIATTLDALASVYIDLGRYEEALPLFEESLEMRKNIHGERHSAVSKSLNNLASLKSNQKDYEAARSLLEQSIEIKKETYGPNHPSVAISVSNLAGIYEKLDRLDEALTLNQEALEIRRSTLRPGHIDVAISINNLAHNHALRNEDDEALRLYEEALAIFKKELGESHPNYSVAMSNVAIAYIKAGDLETGTLLLSRSDSLITQFAYDVLLHTSDENKNKFLLEHSGYSSGILTQVMSDPKLASFGLATVLRRKNLPTEIMALQQAAVQDTDNPDTNRLLAAYRQLSRQIASLTFQNPSATDLQDVDQSYTTQYNELDQLHQDRNAVADSLARLTGAQIQAQSIRLVSALEVRDALKDNQILVEFESFMAVDFQNFENIEHHYSAITLKPDGSIDFYDLGLAAEIDSLVTSYQREIGLFSPSMMGLDQQQLSLRRLEEINRALYQKVIAPLALPDDVQLYISPAGYLHFLPFEMLVDDVGQYMIDKYPMSYLVAGRDLARFDRNAGIDHDGNTYIFADVDFNGLPGLLTTIDQSSSGTEGESRRPEYSADRQPFKELPGTRREAELLSDMPAFRGQVFQRGEAHEGNLAGLVRPRRLHLATHGFYLSHPDEIEQLLGWQTITSMHTDQAINRWKERMYQFLNPLLRSGLALSGANRGITGKTNQGEHDGILTAYEISGLDLRGTELVVLSACETGSGDVATGEGISGLGQAFQLAGAETVVQSLWSVDDAATQQLMVDFYQRMENGDSKAEALRGAALALKNSLDFAHPYYWAAFVLKGNPD